jgi:60kDa lysophospholipase
LLANSCVCVFKHLAATGPNVEILREFLSQGASVHLRNREGHTPLYVAALAGRAAHVGLLRDAGAHLHSGEVDSARLHAQDGDRAAIWEMAGVHEHQG